MNKKSGLTSNLSKIAFFFVSFLSLFDTHNKNTTGMSLAYFYRLFIIGITFISLGRIASAQLGGITARNCVCPGGTTGVPRPIASGHLFPPCVHIVRWGDCC